ncbi:MAG: class I SAM-dependent methyltransferase [Actinomycetota bacterium]
MEIIDREKQFWDQHDEFDWMAEHSKRAVVAMLPRPEGDILELCIGSGMLTEHLPKTYRSYTGLDLSDTLLDTLRRKMQGLTLVQGDAENLRFEDASFDAVLVFAGLHHLPHFERAIAEAGRVLRKGGVFVCLEPSSRAWYRKPMELLRNWIGIYSEDEVFLDPRRVIAALRSSGFDDIREQYLTPAFNPSFLTPRNKVLARMLYFAAAMGRSSFTQSFFLIGATRR